eukprot:TRINITY_DN2762_c0_g1_i1.p1 TRINITY_DN2762_c0_g1~~TRINITY_DN2762_c0_g1_i1.p1  ORF type:complete len:179 (-),score=28.03 TRINITY_DN2762_c0_g1_i1:16-552(-)
MPKYYCDYCDIFLTHDSPSVRKSHNEGWKHKAAVRMYYSQFEQDAAQHLIQQRVREYGAQYGMMGGYPGFASTPGMPPVFNPHAPPGGVAMGPPPGVAGPFPPGPPPMMAPPGPFGPPMPHGMPQFPPQHGAPGLMPTPSGAPPGLLDRPGPDMHAPYGQPQYPIKNEFKREENAMGN